jgi:hypothetical protein
MAQFPSFSTKSSHSGRPAPTLKPVIQITTMDVAVWYDCSVDEELSCVLTAGERYRRETSFTRMPCNRVRNPADGCRRPRLVPPPLAPPADLLRLIKKGERVRLSRPRGHHRQRGDPGSERLTPMR